MTEMLTIWTIYQNPRDYPGKFVMRAHECGKKPKKECVVADTLAEIHAQLPPGLMRFPRDPSDDPVIVEAWM